MAVRFVFLAGDKLAYLLDICVCSNPRVSNVFDWRATRAIFNVVVGRIIKINKT